MSSRDGRGSGTKPSRILRRPRPPPSSEDKSIDPHFAVGPLKSPRALISIPRNSRQPLHKCTTGASNFGLGPRGGSPALFEFNDIDYVSYALALLLADAWADSTILDSNFGGKDIESRATVARHLMSNLAFDQISDNFISRIGLRSESTPSHLGDDGRDERNPAIPACRG